VITDVLDAIAGRIQSATGLRSFALSQGTVAVPCAVVMPVGETFINYDSSMAGQSHDMGVSVFVLVSQATVRTGQVLLYPYLDWAGEKSIYQAFSGWSDPSAGISYAAVGIARNVGAIVWGAGEGAITYTGAELAIMVGIE
jgi:hypothetical protein